MSGDSSKKCPVETTVSLIGNKWKLLILRNLVQRVWRFNELMRDLDGISQRILTKALRELEADGLVIRTVFDEVPPHVEYSLSDLGKSLYPILLEMEKWGNMYLENNLKSWLDKSDADQ